jgi:hypothetical protein
MKAEERVLLQPVDALKPGTAAGPMKLRVLRIPLEVGTSKSMLNIVLATLVDQFPWTAVKIVVIVVLVVITRPLMAPRGSCIHRVHLLLL